jgi:formylglycine-generating enzyme required for sulfatase activity
VNWYDADWYSNAAATGTGRGEFDCNPNPRIRGGFFGSGAADLRAAHRGYYAPATRVAAVGLRCAAIL